MAYSVVAARFATFAAADSAAHVLFASNVSPEDVNVCFAGGQVLGCADSGSLHAGTDDGLDIPYQAQANVSGLSTIGAVLGAAVVLGFDGPALLMLGGGAVGAFVGSWTGAMWLASRAHSWRDRRQQARVLLTAHIPTSQAGLIASLLAEAGGTHVERSRGRWEHGRWVDETGTAVKNESLAAVPHHTPYAG